ncbi:phosphopyruvate hydratase [Candidatus Pacearchaeota archaeon]|nr:phosphopyruvate hydratase [Candidatus Pacearchaeota archaeon]|tara:strand:+ start:1255 stop:2496 length:1242 start_codon:yes stop_codon:yes gene_type:complete
MQKFSVAHIYKINNPCSNMIKEVKATSILDSNKNSTVKVTIKTDNGSFIGISPSGTSKGKHEAHTVSTKKAIKNINKIAKKLKSQPLDQKKIDNLLIRLAGKNKSRLGVNTILPISMAIARAAAKEENLPLYKYIKKISNSRIKVPIPMVLLFEGGRHSVNSSDIQESMIIPKAKTLSQSLKNGIKVYNTLKKLLKRLKLKTNLGMEGAFSPKLQINEDYFSLILEAIKESKINKKDIKIAIDAAASEFYHKNSYHLKRDNLKLSSKELSRYYSYLTRKFPIVSIEDPFDQSDWKSWKSFNKKSKIMTVGDDLTVTNPSLIKKAIKINACNSFIIKPNQIGTISETIEAVKLAKSFKLKTIISHRSGETNDDFISDLGAGLGVDYIKAGSLSKKERMAKYNRLLKIENELRKT